MRGAVLFVGILVLLLVTFPGGSPEAVPEGGPPHGPAHLVPPDPSVRSWPEGVSPGAAPLDPMPTAATGAKSLLVLFVDFADVVHNTSHDATHFRGLLNDPAPALSLRAYFEEVSYGAMTISATLAPAWTSSVRTMASYGADSGSGVDDANGPVYGLVVEAVRAADPLVDFGSFDGDGDGAVDHLVVVHAGGAQEAERDDYDLIWSHSWYVYDADLATGGIQSLVADGVQVYDYIMISEDSPVGVLAHEFGHDLGLPDLYDADKDADDVDAGVGAWDVMGTGAWNGLPRGSSPAHPSAWTRSRLGWIVPSFVDAPARTLTMGAVETTGTAWKLPVTTDAGGSEYFLLENRQPMGFDAGLPGSGLLVWHIDETQATNDVDSHRLVDLEEADEQFTGDRPKDPEDAWSSSAEGFGPWTTPESRDYAGAPTGWRVRDISASSDNMTLTVARDLPQDLVVAEIRAPELVAIGSTVRADAIVRNEGTAAISGNVTLRAHRGMPDTAPLLAEANASVVGLLPGNTITVPIVFGAETAGRYVIRAIATAEKDALRTNDERLAHVVADAIAFDDELESGPGNWTTDGLANDTHRWMLVDDANPNGSSWSHRRAWRFGAVWDPNPNPATAPWHALTSRPIAVPAGPLHLVFRHRYDLWGRPGTETPASDLETDHATIEARFGGGNWTVVGHYRGRDLRWTTVDLELAANLSAPTTLEIRFNASSGVLPDAAGWWIDDVVVRSRGIERAVLLLPSSRQLEAQAGGGSGFDLRIVNLGDTEEAFEFTAEAPAGWQVWMIRGDVSPRLAAQGYRLWLAPDESAVLRTIIEIPGREAPGTNGSVILSGFVVAEPGVSYTIAVDVHVAAPTMPADDAAWLIILLVAGVLAGVLGLVLLLGRRLGPRT